MPHPWTYPSRTSTRPTIGKPKRNRDKVKASRKAARTCR